MSYLKGILVFDKMVDYIFSYLDANNYEKRSLIAELIEALEDQGWDCVGRSKFFDNSLVKEAFDIVRSRDNTESGQIKCCVECGGTGWGGNIGFSCELLPPCKFCNGTGFV